MWSLDCVLKIVSFFLPHHVIQRGPICAVRTLHAVKMRTAVWIGVIQLSGSWLWTPLVVALCRRKSTRLTAVLGGLVLALAALFASFAQQLHQVFLR